MLEFAAGQSQATVSVEILDDDVVEVTEQFNGILSIPSPGVMLGVDTAIVDIVDDTGM